MSFIYDEIESLAKEYDEEGYYVLPSYDEVCAAVLDYILKHKDDPRLAGALKLYEEDEKEFIRYIAMIVDATFKEVEKGWTKRDTPWRVSMLLRPHDAYKIGAWKGIGEVAVGLCKPPPGRVGRPKREYNLEELRKLKEQGMSIRKIAEKTGIPKTTVHRLLSRPTN